MIGHVWSVETVRRGDAGLLEVYLSTEYCCFAFCQTYLVCVWYLLVALENSWDFGRGSRVDGWKAFLIHFIHFVYIDTITKHYSSNH